jgi:LPS export ABC transporter protein LptC/lipopolysaccharide transport protein LptA
MSFSLICVKKLGRLHGGIAGGILAAAVVVFCSLLVRPVYAEDEVKGKDKAKEAAIQQEFEGFNLNGYTKGGEKSWEINGDKANISDNKVKITNVDANSFADGADNQNVNLKSKTGSIDKASGNVHLQDEVVITSEKGAKMTTDSLDWKRNENLVTTEDPVVITDDALKVTGKGMTAHPDLKTASIKEDVKAHVSTESTASKPSQNITITSDGPMEMDQTAQKAIFNENVVATEVATGRQLKADKMEVYFDQKAKGIKKLICTGNVSVHQGENVSYAEKLVYDGATQKMTLSGSPKLIFDMTDQGGGKNIFKGLGGSGE